MAEPLDDVERVTPELVVPEEELFAAVAPELEEAVDAVALEDPLVEVVAVVELDVPVEEDALVLVVVVVVPAAAPVVAPAAPVAATADVVDISATALTHVPEAQTRPPAQSALTLQCAPAPTGLELEQPRAATAIAPSKPLESALGCLVAP